MDTKQVEAAVKRIWDRHTWDFMRSRCACGTEVSFMDHEMHVAVAVWRSART